MSQTRYDDFKAADSTIRFNRKLRGVIRQGVYTGFNVVVGYEGGRRVSLLHQVDPDENPVDSGATGATILDGGGSPRRFRDVGQNFLTTVSVGDILVVNEPAPNNADNGDYIVCVVVDNENLDVERVFPSGGGALINLNYTVHNALGVLRTPDGVFVEESACQDHLFTAGYSLQHDVGDAQDRIDLVVARYVYNAGAPPNVCTYMIIKGTPGAPPSPPAATDNDVILAQVYVPAGAGVITQDNIYSSEKQELYGAGMTDKLDERNKLLAPGVYDGLLLQAGSGAFDITISAGTLLTPQFYKVREDAALTDQLTVVAAAAGQYRYDWVICLHRWTAMDPVDEPIYMTVTGTPQVLATEATLPTDANILAAIGLVAAKYDSLNYVTRLGYIKVTNTAVEYRQAERKTLPDTIRVNDGMTSYGNHLTSSYYGAHGLKQAVADFYAAFELLLRSDAAGYDTGSAIATILLDGQFSLPAPLRLPSCLAIRGEGAPAHITTHLAAIATPGLVRAEGKSFTWDTLNNIFGAIVDLGVVGLPANYRKYRLTVSAPYQTGDDFDVSMFMRGDMVELYSPSGGTTHLSRGWVSQVTGPWIVEVILQDPTGAHLVPDPTIDVDCSMVLRKRAVGIENVRIDYGFTFNYVMRGIVRDVGSGWMQAYCDAQSTFDNVHLESAVASLWTGGAIAATDQPMWYAYTAGGSPYGANKNRYSKIHVALDRQTTIAQVYLGFWETNSTYNDIFVYCNTGFLRLYGKYENYPRVENSYGSISIRTCSFSNFGYLKASTITTDGATSTDLVISYAGGNLTLAAGTRRVKVYFAESYTDSSGFADNYHYFDTIAGADNEFLRQGFQDFIIPAAANTGLTDNALTNPHGIKFDDARGLFGVERIYTEELVHCGEYDAAGLVVYRVPSRDVRVRLGGQWSSNVLGRSIVVSDDTTASYIEVTFVGCGIAFFFESGTVAFANTVDGVLTGNTTSRVAVPYTGVYDSLAPTTHADYSNLTQDIHTVRLQTPGAAATPEVLVAIEIYNWNAAGTLTELAGEILNGREYLSLGMTTPVAFPVAAANGGRAVRYVRESDHTRQWASTNVNAFATVVAAPGAGGGGANIPVSDSSGYAVGDLVRVSDAAGHMLHLCTGVAAGNLTVAPVVIVAGYPAGTVVTRYGHSCYSGVTNVAHANEEVSHEMFLRAFGVGETSGAYIDFQPANEAAIAEGLFTMADNNHSLVVENVRGVVVVTEDYIELNGANDDLYLTWIGTGLDLVRLTNTLADAYNMWLDGVPICTAGFANQLLGAGNLHSALHLCSDLPYGTHTLRLERAAAAVASGSKFLFFRVYKPVEPAYVGTKLYECNLLPTTANILSNSAGATILDVTRGCVRFNVHRGWYHDGGFTYSRALTYRGGDRLQSATNGADAYFRYYGSQVVLWGTKGTNTTFSIDGVGDYLFNAVVGPITVGWHEIHILKGDVSNTYIEAVDVQVAAYDTWMPQASYFDHFIAGSQIRDMRGLTPVKADHLTEGGFGKVARLSNSDNNSVNVRSMPGCFVNINSQGRPVSLQGMAQLKDITPGGAVLLQVDVSVDGRIPDCLRNLDLTLQNNTYAMLAIVSQLQLGPGTHFINVIGQNAAAGPIGIRAARFSLSAHESA